MGGTHMGAPSGGTPGQKQGEPQAVSTRSPFNGWNPYGGTLWGHPRPEAGGAAGSQHQEPIQWVEPIWGHPLGAPPARSRGSRRQSAPGAHSMGGTHMGAPSGGTPGQKQGEPQAVITRS